MTPDRKQSSKVLTGVLTKEPAARPDDDLYAVAMLKVAMELKRSNNKGFEEIFESTLKSMNVDRATFKSYLAKHMDKLLSTAKERGY